MPFTQREIDEFSDHLADIYGVPRDLMGRPPLVGCDIPRDIKTEQDAIALRKALEHRWR